MTANTRKPSTFNRSRNLWAMTCAAAVLAAAGPLALAPAVASAAVAEAAIPVLGKAELDALLAAPQTVLFLDVRRADELGSIGAFPVFLNIQNSELDRFLAYIPRDRQIVTVSNHAHRAQTAGALLARNGFKVIGAAGVQDYEAQGGVLSGKTLTTAAIPGVVAAGARIQIVREGFNGTEGPVVLDDGSILFTENRADRIVRVAPDNSFSTYLEKTGGANALAVKASGELVAVQTAPSAIAVLKPGVKPLADKYQGKPFNRPNDLVVARAGDVYFTDPGAAPAPGAPPAKTAVYWLDRKGAVHPIADDIRRPNGIALSPDEKTLYVANTAGESLIAFTVKPDGSVGERRDFAKLAGFRETSNGPSSGADGIAVDADGRVYVATSAGVQIFTPDGKAAGVIALPNAPQNLAFGGPKRADLFVVGRGSVYRIATQTHGVDRPGK